MIKSKDKTPDYIIIFFDNILDNNVAEYYDKFMQHKDILKKYAIDYQMAEDLPQSKRYKLYNQFKDEVGYNDVEVSLEPSN